MTDLDFEIPLVVCQSRGGPYVDADFVAGYTAARVEISMKLLVPDIHGWVDSRLLPQLDLLAMRYNYALTCVTSDPAVALLVAVQLTALD